MTRVVHCKKEPFDVYIGYPSKWFNRFGHKPGKRVQVLTASRAESVSRHREETLADPALIEAIKRELKDKTQGCWCHPLSCHGDTYAMVANEGGLL